MDIASCLQESELEEVVEELGVTTESGKAQLFKRLHEWSFSEVTLSERADQVLRLRRWGEKNPEKFAEIQTDLQEISKHETILRADPPTKTQEAAEGQIFFQGEWTKPLNSIPQLITILVFLKIQIAPLAALFMPIVMFLAPYVILRTMFQQDMPFDWYINFMKHMVFGLQPGEPWRLKHQAQSVWTVASMGQGMVQPWLTAYHTQKLDATIVERGNALIQTVQKGSAILKLLHDLKALPTTLQFPETPTEPREAVAQMTQEKLALFRTYEVLGAIDVTVALAADTQFQKVLWVEPGNSFLLQNFHDLRIQTEPKRSDLNLVQHSLLTGPNRGGKSSALRGILQQVLLGQTLGFTYRALGSWTPFGWIHTRLKSSDSAGKESLFEMEVRKASTMLRHAQRSKRTGLILIDELFHSTNPPDAETSARIFLQQLWVLPNVKSVVSTHIFTLCEELHDKVEALCCPAHESEDGQIHQTQTLKPGVCRVSSVREVLQESGLLKQGA